MSYFWSDNVRTTHASTSAKFNCDGCPNCVVARVFHRLQDEVLMLTTLDCTQANVYLVGTVLAVECPNRGLVPRKRMVSSAGKSHRKI